MKICTKCKVDKPLSDFNKCNKHKDGLRTFCRICQSIEKKKYRERYAFKVTAAKKTYYIKNKDKIAEKSKIWKANNKDKILKSRIIHKKKYGNKTILQFNKDKILLQEKAKKGALRKEYKESIKNNNLIKTELQKFVAQEMYELAQIRKKQTGFDWHVDHIEPLSKGGKHAINNLQVVPALWNLSKGNRNNSIYKLGE